MSENTERLHQINKFVEKYQSIRLLLDPEWCLIDPPPTHIEISEAYVIMQKELKNKGIFRMLLLRPKLNNMWLDYLGAVNRQKIPKR